MNLNYNSITAKLYRWFYAKYEMPKNLCPYFWKLVIMWIFIIPYTILSLPYIAMYKWNKGDSVAEKPGTGLFLYFILGLFLSAMFSISAFWIWFPDDTFLSNIQSVGIVVWITAFILGIIEGYKFLRTMYLESKRKRDYDRMFDKNNYIKPKRESNIIVEWVKSTYNKSCPKIDWNQTNK
jgi:hypothetical protein